MGDQELHCMNCGSSNITYRNCKILCQNCGFMLDCSDLDVGGEVQRAAVEQQRELRHDHELQQDHSPATK